MTGKADRRRQILLVAKCLMEKKPFEKLRFTEIASELNIDPKLVHYYFKDKESLLLGLFDFYLEDYAQLAENLEKQRTLSAVTALSLIRDNVRHHLPTLRTIMSFALNQQLDPQFIKTNRTWRLNETYRKVLNLSSKDPQDEGKESILLLMIIFLTIANSEVYSDYFESFFALPMSDENSDLLLQLLANICERMTST
ncbi:TetR/AcrR family transcriptional regulator [Aliikangiella coralliicola]|uniref:TetR/AcrR family transcriptional regulator n=1 Tax=Aliikangiella coralliicola TaxID=2592383 RepID=UPI00143D60C8|nr:TetR/AcrR family transcriptional regulator [Aliikangiella coralliicola]